CFTYVVILSFFSTAILINKNIRPINVNIGAIKLKDATGRFVTTTPPINAPKAFPKLNADWLSVLASVGASCEINVLLYCSDGLILNPIRPKKKIPATIKSPFICTKYNKMKYKINALNIIFNALFKFQSASFPPTTLPNVTPIPNIINKYEIKFSCTCDTSISTVDI